MRCFFLIIALLAVRLVFAQAGPERHSSPSRAVKAAEAIQPAGSGANVQADQALRACLMEPAYGPNWLAAWEWASRVNPYTAREQRMQEVYHWMDSIAGASAEVALIHYLHTHDARFFDKAVAMAGEADWIMPYRIREAAQQRRASLPGLLATYRNAHPLSSFRHWYFSSVLQTADTAAHLKVKGMGELIPLLTLQQLEGIRKDLNIEPLDSVCDCTGAFLTMGTPADLRSQFRHLQVDGLLLRIAGAVSIEEMIGRLARVDWSMSLQPASAAEGSLYGNFLPALQLTVSYLAQNKDGRLPVWKERLDRINALYQTYR